MALKFNPFSWGKKNKNNPQLEKDVEQLKQQVQALTADLQAANQKIQQHENTILNLTTQNQDFRREIDWLNRQPGIVNGSAIAYIDQENVFTAQQNFQGISLNSLLVYDEITLANQASLIKNYSFNDPNIVPWLIVEQIETKQQKVTFTFDWTNLIFKINTIPQNSSIQINQQNFPK